MNMLKSSQIPGSLVTRSLSSSLPTSADAIIRQSESKLASRFGLKDREFARTVKAVRKDHATRVVTEVLAHEADVIIHGSALNAQGRKLAAAVEAAGHSNAVARAYQVISNEHDRTVVDQSARALRANAEMAQAHRKATDAADLSPEDRQVVIQGIDMLVVMGSQYCYDRAEIMLTENKKNFERALTVSGSYRD